MIHLVTILFTYFPWSSASFTFCYASGSSATRMMSEWQGRVSDEKPHDGLSILHQLSLYFPPYTTNHRPAGAEGGTTETNRGWTAPEEWLKGTEVGSEWEMKQMSEASLVRLCSSLSLLTTGSDIIHDEHSLRYPLQSLPNLVPYGRDERWPYLTLHRYSLHLVTTGLLDG